MYHAKQNPVTNAWCLHIWLRLKWSDVGFGQMFVPYREAFAFLEWERVWNLASPNPSNGRSRFMLYQVDNVSEHMLLLCWVTFRTVLSLTCDCDQIQHFAIVWLCFCFLNNTNNLIFMILWFIPKGFQNQVFIFLGSLITVLSFGTQNRMKLPRRADSCHSRAAGNAQTYTAAWEQ